MTRRVSTRKLGSMIQGSPRQTGHDPRSPHEAEYRPEDVSPAPAVPFADLVAEMWANDEEAIEWRRSERLGDLFGRSR